MTMLMEDNAKAKTAATVLLTIPGVPYLYYGEEIGMTGQKPDERIRTPMQWSAEHEAGFTRGTAWEVINPNFAEYNVAAQTADSASLLSHYRTLIQLRNQHAALRVGEYLPVEADNRNVLAFLLVSNEETVLVVINLGKDAVGEYQLTLAMGPLAGKVKVAPLFGQGKFIPPQVNAQGGFEGYQPLPEIPANSSFILQLQASR
jgi:glycosidase